MPGDAKSLEVTVPFGAGNLPYARRLQIPVLAPRSPETPKRPKTWRLDPMKGREKWVLPWLPAAVRAARLRALIDRALLTQLFGCHSQSPLRF